MVLANEEEKTGEEAPVEVTESSETVVTADTEEAAGTEASGEGSGETLFVPEVIEAEVDERPEMDLDCPKLRCEDNILEPGVCYSHDGKASAETIKGGLCYDVETAKQTDQVLVCPFNTREYMWINELYQGQERNELNMKCKSYWPSL